ncbi:MAG: M23 family metallopeptidase [Thermodesulfovibrionales bacterium]|nr:M23 family metallopeptidase [Thermodesulfovibrionales bacterium]
MNKIKMFIKRLFTAITIMVIPHDNRQAASMRLPSIGIFLFFMAGLAGLVFVAFLSMNTIEYHEKYHSTKSMLNTYKSDLQHYKRQFSKIRDTLSSLKKAEAELRVLVSFDRKEEILKNLENIDVEGACGASSEDVDLLRKEIDMTMEKVSAIREFLRRERVIYLATPMGWPVYGRVTSPFGMRIHPVTGVRHFHKAIDIAAPPGTPIRATADGVVDFSGWHRFGGNVIAIEHELGHRTVFKHNKRNLVVEGQEVRRGDIIAYVGNTGRTSGPHLSYEIRHLGKPVNPWNYLQKRVVSAMDRR